MKANEVFDKIHLNRDFTGSEADSYAQLLQTMLFELTAQGHEKEFLNLLDKAEKEKKKLYLISTSGTHEPFTTKNEVVLENIVIR